MTNYTLIMRIMLRVFILHVGHFTNQTRYLQIKLDTLKVKSDILQIDFNILNLYHLIVIYLYKFFECLHSLHTLYFELKKTAYFIFCELFFGLPPKKILTTAMSLNFNDQKKTKNSPNQNHKF